MHRKHIRATDAATGLDVDVPTAIWADGQFLIYTAGELFTQFVVQSHNVSTDNAVARWDGATGHLIQDSTVIVDDAGNLTGVGTINGNDVSKFVRGPTPAISTNTAIAIWTGTGGRDIANSVVTIDSSGNLVGVGTLNGQDLSRFVRYNPTYFPYHNEVVCVDNVDPITNLPIAVSGRTVKIAGFGVMYDVVSLNGRDPMQWVDGPITHVATDSHVALWDTNSGRLIKDSAVAIDPGGNITTPGDMNPATVAGIPKGVLVKSSGVTPHPNNNVARWDSATGHPLKDSTVFIDDSGNVTGVLTINTIDPATWVRGPASATDNAVARYDLTTGKLIKDSVAILGNTGNISGLLNVSCTTINSRDPNAWVSGPIASTDGNIAIFDTSTGKAIRDSGIKPGQIFLVYCGLTVLASTPVTVLLFTAVEDGNYLATVFIAYAISDTGSDITLSVSSTGSLENAAASAGGQGFVSITSGATGTLATSGTNPAPIAGVITLSIVADLSVGQTISFTLSSTGSSHTMFNSALYVYKR